MQKNNWGMELGLKGFVVILKPSANLWSQLYTHRFESINCLFFVSKSLWMKWQGITPRTKLRAGGVQGPEGHSVSATVYTCPVLRSCKWHVWGWKAYTAAIHVNVNCNRTASGSVWSCIAKSPGHFNCNRQQLRFVIAETVGPQRLLQHTKKVLLRTHKHWSLATRNGVVMCFWWWNILDSRDRCWNAQKMHLWKDWKMNFARIAWNGGRCFRDFFDHKFTLLWTRISSHNFHKFLVSFRVSKVGIVPHCSTHLWFQKDFIKTINFLCGHTDSEILSSPQNRCEAVFAFSLTMAKQLLQIWRKKSMQICIRASAGHRTGWVLVSHETEVEGTNRSALDEIWLYNYNWNLSLEGRDVKVLQTNCINQTQRRTQEEE